MSFTGYRLYRGRGGPASIDWTTPVATAPAGADSIVLAGAGHDAGCIYTYGLRPVRDDVESPDRACLAELALDGTGQWTGERPAPVTALTAAAADGAVRVRWHWRAEAGTPAADRFAVFVSAALPVGTAAPTATVEAEGDGIYSAEVMPGEAMVYVAVRAEIDDGAASTVVTAGPVVIPSPPPMPAPWVDVMP